MRPGRALVFPRDHGAHLDQRIEWWYVTGWLGSGASGEGTAPTHGFQLTFFRRRTGVAEGLDSRFAARHLLLAHAALTELPSGRHRHAERVARWSGADDAALRDRASLRDGFVALDGWRLAREGADASTWTASVDARGWSFVLRMRAPQRVLLQGDAGFSRKGPLVEHASHYYSDVQLDVEARLVLDGAAPVTRRGRAWLDHEWSDTLMPTDAVGWDWIGMNLFDGSALMAFRLRRADGSAVWTGGSHRGAGTDAMPRAFASNEVTFTPGRTWRSAATDATYPVTWHVETPAGRFEVRSLADAQELDARTSTGTVYWEGLAALHDARGQRVGLGYLEMTGYAQRLRW